MSNDSHCFAYFLEGDQITGKGLYVMINTYWQPLTFEIQEKNKKWRRAIDTNLTGDQAITPNGTAIILNAEQYQLAPRSVVVLIEQ